MGMTAPRPNWMPSRESLLALAHNEALYADCGHTYAGEEMEEMVREVGIKAQIEALEEVVERVEPKEKAA